jgi:hypothetical protein
LQEVTAAFVTIALGVIAVAAIYQLSTPGGVSLTSDVTNLGTSTLGSLFTSTGGGNTATKTPAKKAA